MEFSGHSNQDLGWDGRSAAIRFVPLESSHLPLMHLWLNAGEPLRWYGRKPQTLEQLRSKYLGPGAALVRPFVIHFGEEPVGHLQCYRLADHPHYAAQVSALPGDCGLDLFIGGDDLVGRGLGTAVVIAALERLVFTLAEVERCLIGPSPDNKRAIRCYEKCGFQHERSVSLPEGDEYLMVLEKCAFARRKCLENTAPAADASRTSVITQEP